MRASFNVRGAAAGGLAVALLTFAGCSARQEYVEVEGTVTLNKKPLHGAMVAFYPDSEGTKQLPYSTATTDASGHYVLTCADGKSGALVGKHRVVVHWPPEEHPSDPRQRPKPPGPPIPVRYTVATETPLLIEVKSDGPQKLDLPLTSP
jgi:hypothetical protein